MEDLNTTPEPKATPRRGRRSVALALLLMVLPGSGADTLGNEEAPVTQRRDQQFRPPRGQVENVTFRQLGAGVIEVRYDLLSEDSTAIFEVTVEVSLDAGQTFGHRPKSATGDVGPGVKPGNGKRIVWEAAKEVEILEIERFRFRVVAQAGRATPAEGLGGVLVVTSEPSGATVFLDGEARGKTPLTLRTLPVGPHQLRLVRDGYLENGRAVVVEEGETEQVTVVLTQVEGQPAPPPPTGRDGINPLIWIVPAVGGGVGAAVLAGRGGDGGPPLPPPVTSCSFSATPSTVNADSTGGQFTITVTVSPSGCSNPSWSVSNFVSWITINQILYSIPGPTVSGNGTVNFTVAANTATTEREGVLTVAGQTITVRQAARSTHSVTITLVEPPSPASLAVNQLVRVTFRYTTTEAGGAIVFTRPFSRGRITGGSTTGSSGRIVGEGVGSAWFTITSPGITVDEIRAQMFDFATQSRLLSEAILPVNYQFGNQP